MRVSQEPVSLETLIGEEDDSHLGDFIPDDDALAPADAASMLLLKEQLNDVLKTLTLREAKVLSCASGLKTVTREPLKKSAASSALPVNASARLRRKRCANCVTRAAAKTQRFLRLKKKLFSARKTAL